MGGCLLIAGCSSLGIFKTNAYRPFKSNYGYLDLQAGKDLYEISFTGSHGQPELWVKKLALTRAAVLADSQGFTHFQVVEEASTYTVQTVVQTETTTEPEKKNASPQDSAQTLPTNLNTKSTHTLTSTENRAPTVKIKTRFTSSECENCLEAVKILGEARRSNWIAN